METLRQRLNSVPAFTSETVEAWGERIEVRSMSVIEKTMITALAEKDGKLAMEVLLPGIIVATCFDPETGDKVFSEDDIEWIKAQNAGVIEQLAAVGIRLSGLNADAISEGKGAS